MRMLATFQDSERAFDIVFKGVVDFYCLKAAHELGIFSALRNGPLHIEELAEATGSVQGRLERLLISLRLIGMLSTEENFWSLTPLSEQFFVNPPSDQNLTMVPFVDYMINLADTFYSNMSDAVRGKLNFTSFVPHPPRTREDSVFYETLHRANIHFPLKLLCENAELEGVKHLVDVGGGIGDIAAALCQKHPQLNVTLINLPNALDLVRENVAEKGLADRITPVAVDMYREPYPQGDAVLFSRILYPMNATFCTALCKRAYEALPVGGRILILDMIIDNIEKPNYDYLSHYVCATGMDFSVLEFKSHTVYPDVLRAAGFHDVRFDQGYDYVLYQAVK